MSCKRAVAKLLKMSSISIRSNPIWNWMGVFCSPQCSFMVRLLIAHTHTHKCIHKYTHIRIHVHIHYNVTWMLYYLYEHSILFSVQRSSIWLIHFSLQLATRLYWMCIVYICIHFIWFEWLSLLMLNRFILIGTQRPTEMKQYNFHFVFVCLCVCVVHKTVYRLFLYCIVFRSFMK